MRFYKKYNFKIDSAILFLLISALIVNFSGVKGILFSKYFNFDKSDLYGILLAIAPTLLGFVITSMSVVLSYLTSDSKIAKEVRSECGQYISTIFIYGKLSLSFMSIVSLLFYLFDSSDFLLGVHYILVVALFYSIFSFLHIILMMGDVMKLIMEQD